MAKIKYAFKDLCKDVRHILPAHLHATGEGNDFIWIATDDYDIGVYPLHYEIRLEAGFVYAEVHCESNGTITYVSRKKSKVFLDEFKKYCVSKGYRIVKNTNVHKWFRKNSNGVKFQKDCVYRILADIIDLEKDSHTDLSKLMRNIFK